METMRPSHFGFRNTSKISRITSDPNIPQLTKITPNVQLVGKFSKIERQIDLLVEDQASDFTFRIAVDAKHYTERIDVKDVEQFLGLLNDVNVDVGVIISPKEYSQAAISRAHYDDSRLELDILNFDELKF